MKGIITDITNGRAIILTQHGEFIRIPDKGYKAGDELDYTPTSYSRPIMAAAAAAAVVTLSIGGYKTYNMPVSCIDVDINPSVRLEINLFNKVIEMYPLNDDARVLLDECSVKSGDLDECINEIIFESGELGYLTDTNANVNIEVISNNDSLWEKAEKYTAGLNLNGIEILTAVEKAGKDDLKKARELNISVGRLKAIEDYGETFGGSSENNAVTLKDVSTKEIKELITKEETTVNSPNITENSAHGESEPSHVVSYTQQNNTTASSDTSKSYESTTSNTPQKSADYDTVVTTTAVGTLQTESKSNTTESARAVSRRSKPVQSKPIRNESEEVEADEADISTEETIAEDLNEPVEDKVSSGNSAPNEISVASEIPEFDSLPKQKPDDVPSSDTSLGNPFGNASDDKTDAQDDNAADKNPYSDKKDDTAQSGTAVGKANNSNGAGNSSSDNNSSRQDTENKSETDNKANNEPEKDAETEPEKDAENKIENEPEKDADNKAENEPEKGSDNKAENEPDEQLPNNKQDIADTEKEQNPTLKGSGKNENADNEIRKDTESEVQKKYKSEQGSLNEKSSNEGGRNSSGRLAENVGNAEAREQKSSLSGEKKSESRSSTFEGSGKENTQRDEKPANDKAAGDKNDGASRENSGLQNSTDVKTGGKE